MRKWGRRLVFSIQFMTRYPINVRLYLQPSDFPAMAAFFPLDGLLVGLFACALAWLADLAGSLLLIAITVPLSYVLMSGAFQIEGLAKSFDMLGRRSRSSRLETITDPHLGVRAKIVLVADILLLAALAYQLCLQEEGFAFYAAIASAPALARLALVSGCVISKSAKSDGIGRPFIEGIRFPDLIRALFLALLLTLPLLGWETALILVALELVLGFLQALFFSGFMAGITGGVLGSINEVGQLLALVGIFLIKVLNLPFSQGLLKSFF